MLPDCSSRMSSALTACAASQLPLLPLLLCTGCQGQLTSTKNKAVPRETSCNVVNLTVKFMVTGGGGVYSASKSQGQASVLCCLCQNQRLL